MKISLLTLFPEMFEGLLAETFEELFAEPFSIGPAVLFSALLPTHPRPANITMIMRIAINLKTLVLTFIVMLSKT